jgi:peptidoglycan hydrolase CwlO-like protein
MLLKDIPDILVRWVGTTNSLIVHSIFFLLSFLSHWIFGLSIDLVLLVLTTVVSLEAIYLAIFIQRSVNQQATRLEDVEDALDDVGESLDDVEESIDDVEESISSHQKHIISPTTNMKLEQSIEEIISELKALKTNIEKKK